MRETAEVPKVLYVVGAYRSGTTLLGNLLGQLDGYFSVGELRAIWRELALANARCGCGLPLTECETWQLILKAAFGSTREAQQLAPSMLRWQEQVLRLNHTWFRVPRLLLTRRLGSIGPPARAYAEGMTRLYRAIARVTGASVIVDSSKEPTDAALMGLLPDVSAYLVHIVRDPRGTVFSSLRARSGAEPSDPQRARSAYMAMGWVAGNMAAAAVRRARGRRTSLLIRYEDLVEEPNRTLDRITRLVAEPRRIPTLEDGAMMMNPTHTVCGNENRFRTGLIHLSNDTAWTRLKPFDRNLITAISAPLMMRYGYPLRP